jgi:hypothetical protein
MHAAIDGTISTEERADLERQLAEDAAARALFEELSSISTRLRALPMVDAPAGLRQVISDSAKQLHSTQNTTIKGSALLQRFRQQIKSRQTNKGTAAMSNESQATFGRQKVWGVVGALTLVVGVIGYLDLGSENSYLIGAIAPAERYQDNTITADDVVLGDDDIAQLLQSDAFMQLIEDESFAQLMVDNRMRALMADGRLHALMADSRWQALMADGRLPALMADGRLPALMADGRMQSLMAEGRMQELMADARMQALMADARMQSLMADGLMQALMADGRLPALMADARMQSLMADGRLPALMADGRLPALMADGRLPALMADGRLAAALQQARVSMGRIAQ